MSQLSNGLDMAKFKDQVVVGARSSVRAGTAYHVAFDGRLQTHTDVTTRFRCRWRQLDIVKALSPCLRQLCRRVDMPASAPRP
jgi:hypothetical protein